MALAFQASRAMAVVLTMGTALPFESGLDLGFFLAMALVTALTQDITQAL